MKLYVIYRTRAKNAKNHRYDSFGRTVYFNSLEEVIAQNPLANDRYDLEVRTTKHEVVARRVKGQWEEVVS